MAALPLVTGHLDMVQSARFAAAIGLIGMAILLWLVNPLTAWLTPITLVGYAGIYTVYLKRATPQNIVIGGAAGKGTVCTDGVGDERRRA